MEPYTLNPTPCTLHPDDVLDLLASLVDQSLLRQQEDMSGEPRFTMLETIREFGRECLAASGEAETLRRKHAGFFLDLAEQAEPQLLGPEQAAWLERLELEHGNLRAALEWCSADGSGVEAGLRLSGALQMFWRVRGFYREGRERLAAALAREAERTAPRAKALHAAGVLARQQGDYADARAFHEESLAIRRELDDRRGVAASLGSLGSLDYLKGDYTAARALYEESLRIHQELGNKQDVAISLNNLGLIARDQGEYPEARVLFERSLAIQRELGNKRSIANALNNLGMLAGDEGDLDAARALHEESLAIAKELDDKQSIANSLNNLGMVAEGRGDFAHAASLYEESLAIRRALGDMMGIADSLCNLGEAACDQGDYTLARSFYQQSLAILRELEDPLGIADMLQNLAKVALAQSDDAAARPLYEESLALRRELGDKVGIAECLEGLAAVACAPLAPGSQLPGAPPGGWSGDRLSEVRDGSLDPQRAERVIRLLGAAEAVREAVHSPLPTVDRAAYDCRVAAAREVLGEGEFTAAWAEGRAMTLEQATRYALEQSSCD